MTWCLDNHEDHPHQPIPRDRWDHNAQLVADLDDHTARAAKAARVIEIAEELGYPLAPWQRRVLAGALDAHDRKPTQHQNSTTGDPQ